MATATSSSLLSHHYPGAHGYPQYVHRPAKYRFDDLPKSNVSDETYTHTTSQVEADTWRPSPSPPKFSETGSQPDNYSFEDSVRSSVQFPHNAPRESLRDSKCVISSTPPARPTQPFAKNAGSFEVMERPQSASSSASSEVSELEPVRPGGEAAREDLARRLRERRFRDLITGDFCCMQCQTFISSPRTQGEASGTLLHLLCPNCPAVYCRGCKKPVRCDRNCNARHNCAVKRCCSEVRAVAIFEYLSAFDQFYLECAAAFHIICDETILDAGQRSEFLNYILSNADQNDARQFLSVLKRTIRTVYFWLLPEEDSNVVDCCVGTMLDVSFLPGVLYKLLLQSRWQGRLRSPRWGSLFHAIEKLIKTLAHRRDEDLTSVVYSPLSVIDQSRGLGAWLWEDDDTCIWKSSHIAGPSQTLAEWISFLEDVSQQPGFYVDHTSSSSYSH